MTTTPTATYDEKSEGHAAHTRAADQPTAMAGAYHRPVKLTFLGAGSHFCPELCRDLLTTPGSRGEIALVDIDAERLDRMAKVVQRQIKDLGQEDRWNVSASTDRRVVMKGSHYLVSCVEVSGVECVHLDNDIPLKYGVDQCIGDTLGPGGLFKALRTVPVFLDILRDARELCPEAIMLNYTNPMSMVCLAAARAVPEIPTIGLCHSVQGTSHKLADYAGVPYEELRWDCAGINHLAWFTRLEHRGEDLYPRLKAKFREEIAAGLAEAEQGLAAFDNRDTREGEGQGTESYQQDDLIRKDMCVHFGAFITESSGHLSEYLPYYRKSDTGRKLLRLGYHGGSRFYATNWPQWRVNLDRKMDKMVAGEIGVGETRSWEYASWIIEAIEKGQPYVFWGNLRNQDASGSGRLITNLPADGCVEVACVASGSGVTPTRYGALPPQMAAVCDMNMRMIDLAATACVERSREAAVHALMLDPLTAAVCTPGEIRAMTDEMFAAEAEFLPGYE